MCCWVQQIASAATSSPVVSDIWILTPPIFSISSIWILKPPISVTHAAKCWNYSLQNVNSSSGTVISVLYASVFYCKFPICSMWKSLQCSRLLFGQTWYSYTIKGKLRAHWEQPHLRKQPSSIKGGKHFVGTRSLFRGRGALEEMPTWCHSPQNNGILEMICSIREKKSCPKQIFVQHCAGWRSGTSLEIDPPNPLSS